MEAVLIRFGFHLVHVLPLETSTTTASSNLPPASAQAPPTKRTPDAMLQGLPLYLQDSNDNKNGTYHTKPYSWSHCVGQNYQEEKSFLHHSCQFRFLCWDFDTQHYVLFQRPDESNIEPWLQQQEHQGAFFDLSQTYLLQPNSSGTTATTTYQHDVSLGGINPKWGPDGISRLKWFPTIRPAHSLPSQYYTLPRNVVLIPYHSLAGWNPGHLVWDDMLPVFTLLHMFQFLPSSSTVSNGNSENPRASAWIPFAVRHLLVDDDGTSAMSQLQESNVTKKISPLWASCDAKPDDCQKMMQKFWPMMLPPMASSQQPESGADSNSGSTSRHSQTLEERSTPVTQTELRVEPYPPNGETSSWSPAANMVCAKNAVAGIGALTDHGVTKLHGWHAEDYLTTHNHGRGGVFWKFRNYCLMNLGIREQPQREEGEAGSKSSVVYKIVFSTASSDVPTRALDFARQIRELKRKYIQSLPEGIRVVILTVNMKELSVKEQLQLATETTIFVTVCGGGAMTGMFLPRGATILLYYDEEGGQVRNNPTGLPARLDWDLFNNLAYLRVHWLPTRSMNKRHDLDILVELIKDDVNRRAAIFGR